MDTFGKCKRPVFSLGVSQHKKNNNKITNFGIDWSSKLQQNNESKNTLVALLYVFSGAYVKGFG